MEKRSLIDRVADWFRSEPNQQVVPPRPLPVPEPPKEDYLDRAIHDLRLTLELEAAQETIIERVDRQLEELKWARYYEESGMRLIDHWPDTPDVLKLYDLMKSTSVAELPARQGREYLQEHVDFAAISEDEQRRIMGEHFERFAPAECHQSPETAIRPLRRVHHDSPELRVEKPLTM